MHYEKSYARLLASLPREICENAIPYRQLKEIIKRIVGELSSLGLTREILYRRNSESTGTIPVGYELNDGKSTRINPQVRIWVTEVLAATLSRGVTLVDSELDGENAAGHQRLLWTFQRPSNSTGQGQGSEQDSDLQRNVGQETIQEVVIPLVQEKEFYNMLTATFESISSQFTAVQSDFLLSLRDLSDIISHSVHPTSAGSKFRPHSATAASAGSIQVKISKLKSDLYSWREIFQLYLEIEVFESVGERTRGERSVEESEKRLQFFIEQLQTQRGREFEMKNSAKALATFLNLNMFILNIKKFSIGSAEATRKILKKHSKRTALPLLLPSFDGPGVYPPLAPLSYATTWALTRTLVQAIGETLIPIIPQIDDYSCLICTSIAFKPIRLSCSHFFCVRCLVKMQKKNKNLCPMCRAPCVLAANQDNVDWGMLNFMQDWFPLEAKEKLQSNEKEAAAEELVELGYNPNAPCLLM